MPEPTPVAHKCTANDPWTSEKGRRAYHPDAIEISETYDWSAYHHDYVTMRCPHCGKEFDVELPN